MQVAVHIAAEAARSLHRLAPENRVSRELREVAGRLGVDLVPLFPGAHDPEAQSQFIVEVPDAQSAERLIRALMKSSATESAYVTPSAELPAGL